MELTLLSFVFCRASFRRFDRLELLFNVLGWRDPWNDKYHGQAYRSNTKYLMFSIVRIAVTSFTFILDRQMLKTSLQSLGTHEVKLLYVVRLVRMT